MGIRTSIFVGVGASAIFFLVQRYLIVSRFPWDVLFTLGVFLAATALAVVFSKRVPRARKEGMSILSDIEAKRGMKAKIDKLETKGPPEKVLSDIKVEGDAEFEIKNTKL